MPVAIFARIGDITGESTDSKHPDEIEVLSWSWGLSQSGTAGHGGGGGAGKVTVRDLVLTHRVDRASPLLMKACATGQHLKEATLTVRKSGRGQQEYLVIRMLDVSVTSVDTSMSAEGDLSTENVVLSFARVDLEYRPQKADGSLDAGVHFQYDVRTQKTS